MDSIRGIAVITVMLYHYSVRYGELFGHVKNPYLFSFNAHGLGIQLFFIISGFTILMTLSNTETIRLFIYKRITRLYPSYIAAVILTFTLTTLYGLSGRTVSASDAIINLTMFQDVLPISVQHVDGVYWTLTVNIIFYFLICTIFALKLNKKIEYAALLWLLVTSLIQILPDNRIVNTLVKYSMADYNYLFIVGMMFFKIRNEKKPIYYIIILLCVAYSAIFMGLTNFIVITLDILIFGGMITGKLLFLDIKPLRYIGTISFSMFLFHQNIGYIIINYMEKIGLVSEFFLIIPIGISIGLASAITFLIEKPVIAYTKKHRPRFLTKSRCENASEELGVH